MIKQIRDYLDSKKIKFWTLVESFKVQSELYTILDKVESIRRVEDSFFLLNVYVDHSGVGSASVKIPKGLSISNVKEIVDSAIESAKSTVNRHYLIEQGRESYLDIDTTLSEDTLEKLLSEVKISGVKLSSTELFVTNSVDYFHNSAGNSYISKRGSILTDIVLLSQDESREVQFLREAKDLDMLNMRSILDIESKFVRDSLVATLPKSGRYRVVLTGEVLEELFSYFIFHSLGSSFYHNQSLFKVGESVGFNITISSDPMDGLVTSISDEFGYRSEPFTFIEEGILKRVVASNRYAQYLNLPFTGSLVNSVIGSGEKSMRELTEVEDTILISKVSSFSPKEKRGDFSAEIRLGYIYKKGKFIPISGGSFSGSFKRLKSMILSKERVYYNSYNGPKAVLLEELDIAGN